MRAAKILNNQNTALMLAAGAVGLYVAWRLFNVADAVGGAVKDGAKAVAAGAGKATDTANNVAKVAQSYTPGGVAVDVAKAVAAPAVKAVKPGGISGAIGDAVDWLRGTTYDPNAPASTSGGWLNF